MQQAIVEVNWLLFPEDAKAVESMLPTTATGWVTWKKSYKGAMGKLFLNKIRIAFGMIALSIV